MAQPILIGLISALALLAAAIITLVGVLATTTVNWKLGRRTGDAAQQSADTARICELWDENKALRGEISQLWQENQDLRKAFKDAQLTKKA